MVTQYAAGEIRVGGFTLRIETLYPAAGEIRVRVLDAPDVRARLRLRVPAWAVGARVAIGAEEPRDAVPGWFDIRRRFVPGDTVVLTLPVEPRVSWPDARIDAVRGTVAVERGPSCCASSRSTCRRACRSISCACVPRLSCRRVTVRVLTASSLSRVLLRVAASLMTPARLRSRHPVGRSR